MAKEVSKVVKLQVRGGAANPSSPDKMVDLNAFEISSAMRMIAGTARSMGLTVKGNAPA